MAGVPGKLTLSDVPRPKTTLKIDQSLSPEDGPKRAIASMAKTEASVNPQSVTGPMDKPNAGIKLKTQKTVRDPYKYMDSDSSNQYRGSATIGEQKANLDKGRTTEDTVRGGRSVVMPDAALKNLKEDQGKLTKT